MTRVRHFLVALLATVLCAVPAQAQTGTISGRIVDVQTLQPLEDVEVRVGDRFVLTDADGRFVVTGLSPGTYTLQATRLGYSDVEQTVGVASGATSSVEIQMVPRAVELAGLVAIGYGERQERDLTGVVQSVSTEEFNRGRVVSTEELIQAKVPGVQVIDTGEPGGGISLRIRGGTSVTSSNEPLFVVDGVPIPPGGGISARWPQDATGRGRNPLNFLNPDDIESITVLKDASAAAIWGAQGANGVILIETKRGAPGPARVTYRGSISGSSVINQVDILNAATFRQVVQEQAPERVDLLGNANTDWRDLVQRSAFGHEHSLGVSGGTEDLNYRLSVGYLNQEAVVRGAETERLSASLSYSQRLFDDRLSLEANAVGSRTDDLFQPLAVLGSATAFAPTQPVRDPSSAFGGFWEWDDPLGPNNPVAELELVSDEGTQYRSVGSVAGTYQMPFLEGLSATLNLGYDVTKAERRVFRPSSLKGEAEGGNPGLVGRSNDTRLGTLVDAYANYARRFGTSDIDFTAGYVWSESRTDFASFFAQGLDFDLLGPDGVPAADIERSTVFIDEVKYASFFGRLNYTLRDKYLLTLSARRDGSSKFGEDERWSTFPAFALAWRMSEEPFMDGWESLSDLKLRFSWGVNGNSAFDSYQAFTDYVLGDPRVQVQFGDEFVSTIRPSAADPRIRWEETKSWNLGLDFGFMQNRVAGSLEYYQKDTDDLIFTVPVAAGTNLSDFVTTNIGSLENKGFEFNIDALVFEGADEGFSWDANFNFSTNDNEVQRINPFGGGTERILTGGIAGGVGSLIQIIQPGQPRNSFYVFEHKRGPDGKPIVGTDLEMYVDQPTVLDTVEIDGVLREVWVPDGNINQDDRVPYKSPDPDVIMGHTSLMRYRNFDLSFTLQAQLGNYVYNNVASRSGYFDVLRDTNAPENIHSSALENEFQGPQYFSDVYVEDASFLRMNNIELGYTFRGGRFDGARVFGAVQNVFTITGYSGIDPTAGVNGIDNNIFPRSRTFTAGVSFGF